MADEDEKTAIDEKWVWNLKWYPIALHSNLGLFFFCHRHTSVRIFTPLPKYSVTRTVLMKDDVAMRAGYQRKDAFTCANHVQNSYRQFSFCQFLYNLIPVLRWLPEYSFKNNLGGDLTAGVTVAVMHIPQGTHENVHFEFINIHEIKWLLIGICQFCIHSFLEFILIFVSFCPFISPVRVYRYGLWIVGWCNAKLR